MRGDHALWRVLALAALAVGALGAAPAGGDGEGLTREQYIRRATRHCKTLKEASDELQLAQAPGATGRRVARYLRQAARKLGDLVDGFRKLDPPRAIEEAAEQLIDVLDGYAEGLETLAGRVKRGQTFRVALERNQDLVTSLNSAAQRATNLVTRLGLTGCLLPT